MNKKTILSTDKFWLEIEYEQEMQGIINLLSQFLSPYFKTSSQSENSCDLKMEIISSKKMPAEIIEKCTKDIEIRKSTADIFNLKGKTCFENGEQYVWDKDKETGYIINKTGRTIKFYASEKSFIHLIELVRYFGLLVEQTRGAFVMHASSVLEKNGNVTAICGVKGAGKTTTMLNKVLNDKMEYFSGDKLLIEVKDNKLICRGWPDYPHIGIGSLRRFPVFIKKILPSETNIYDYEKFKDSDKLLLDPIEFYSVLGKPSIIKANLEKLILPEVNSQENKNVKVSVSQINEELLKQIHEDASTFKTATWHGISPDKDSEKYNKMDLAQLIEKLKEVEIINSKSQPIHDWEEYLSKLDAQN